MTPYVFTDREGRVVSFGPGYHLRIWRNPMGKAHDILIDFEDAAWHCPGPGQCFRRDPWAALLAGALFVEVVCAPNSHEDLRNRINRARLLEGLPWSFFEANCQHTISWATTGTATSFQLESLFALAFLVAIGSIALNRDQSR